MSGMLAPIGILSAPLAEVMNLSVTQVTASFSALTLGLLAGSTLALQIFRFLSVKQVAMLSAGGIGIALLGLNIAGDTLVVWALIAVVGIGCGTGLACGALVISRSFVGRLRAAMLVLTDSCFSMAGAVMSMLAVWFVANDWPWYAVYQVLAIICLISLALSVFSRFEFADPNATSAPDADSKNVDSTSEPEESEPDVLTFKDWPLGVWCCIAGLSLYTLGTNCYLLWLPNYAQTQLSLPLETAGGLVGQYWSGMFFGQLLVALGLTRISVTAWVRIAVLGTFFGSLPLLWVADAQWLSVLALLWGVMNFGCLKMMISFATTRVRVPSGQMVAALMLAGTFGTSISAAVTSWIVDYSDSFFVLKVGSGCLLLMAVAIIAASRMPVTVR